MKKPFDIFYIVALIVALIAVRAFEDVLFYDPLIYFFKTDHSTQNLPKMEIGLMLANTFLRFVINTILSLVLLWFIFRSKEIIKLSAILYFICFLIATTGFIYFIYNSAIGENMALFYFRRFLIQPLLLLLLVPAFYFQKKSSSKVSKG